MIKLVVFCKVANRQTDRQTDRQRRVKHNLLPEVTRPAAHENVIQGGSKMTTSLSSLQCVCNKRKRITQCVIMIRLITEPDCWQRRGWCRRFDKQANHWDETSRKPRLDRRKQRLRVSTYSSPDNSWQSQYLWFYHQQSGVVIVLVTVSVCVSVCM